MSKLYVQSSASLLDYSGALAGSNAGIGGSTSGSLYCDGYTRLIGGLFLAASLQSGSGFQVHQSVDGGTTWDIISACNTLAAGASTFSYEIFGDAVKVKLSNGSSANTVRTLWRVLPIQSPDKVSWSSGSVTVSSGSVVVTGGSLALLSGVNDAGIVHVGTGTCSMGAVTQSAGSNLHTVLETSTSTIGSVTQSAGSNFHAMLETSTSNIGIVLVGTGACAIGNIVNIQNQISASISGGSAALLAGENHIGEIGGKTVVVTACFPREVNTTQYAIGDMWASASTNGTLVRLPNCARKDGGSGVIDRLVLVDSASQATMPQLNLFIFDNVITSPSDNAPFPLTDAEAEKIVAVIPVTSWYAGGSTLNAVSIVTNLTVPFVCQSGCNSLWAVPVLQNTYTPLSAENLTARIGILDD